MIFLVFLWLMAVAHAEDLWPALSDRVSSFSSTRHRDAALIVAISAYDKVSGIEGAAQNGLDWHSYLTKSQGIPSSRVRTLLNDQATREAILKQAREVSRLASAKGKIWFVFIGHGAPSKDGKDGLLLGADVRQNADSIYQRGVSQQELLTLLESSGAAVFGFVDTCFSGKSTGGNDLVRGLQPLIPSTSLSIGKSTVLSAGRSDEFAGSLPGLNRPAFSYLALGALRGWGDKNRDGRVRADEIISYASEALMTFSTTMGRTQRPQGRGPGMRRALARAREKGPDIDGIFVQLARTEISKSKPRKQKGLFANLFSGEGKAKKSSAKKAKAKRSKSRKSSKEESISRPLSKPGKTKKSSGKQAKKQKRERKKQAKPKQDVSLWQANKSPKKKAENTKLRSPLLRISAFGEAGAFTFQQVPMTNNTMLYSKWILQESSSFGFGGRLRADFSRYHRAMRYMGVEGRYSASLYRLELQEFPEPIQPLQRVLDVALVPRFPFQSDTFLGSCGLKFGYQSILFTLVTMNQVEPEEGEPTVNELGYESLQLSSRTIGLLFSMESQRGIHGDISYDYIFNSSASRVQAGGSPIGTQLLVTSGYQIRPAIVIEGGFIRSRHEIGIEGSTNQISTATPYWQGSVTNTKTSAFVGIGYQFQ